MIAFWKEEALKREDEWGDPALVREGHRVFDDLLHSTATHVLLVTDLHAGNVLRAQREPWLAIDPKPFVGDRAYDLTQHLFNCRVRMLTAPTETIWRLAGLAEVDAERVRLWMFARAAAEPRDRWDKESLGLARRLV